VKTWLWRVVAVVVLAVVALLAWQWQSDLPLATLTARWGAGSSRFLAVDGMRVHYRDEGRGPPILLIHGTGASLHTWDDWSRALVADERRVVRLDLPAFGLTGPIASGDYRISAYVDFLDHFVAALGLDRFVVGGNSLGGAVAWEYAAAHADKVQALVLVDAFGYPLTTPVPLAFRLGRLPVLSWLSAHLEPRWLVARTLRLCYGEPSRVTPALVERYRELALRPGNRAAFAARTAAPFVDDTAQLRRLHLPVLVLWGARDQLIPVAHAARFAVDVAGAEVHIYAALGHVPQEEDGARTVTDVRTFLAKLPR
jgi:pimeloyl-ACP methyl ester carboxylesterase